MDLAQDVQRVSNSILHFELAQPTYIAPHPHTCEHPYMVTFLSLRQLSATRPKAASVTALPKQKHECISCDYAFATMKWSAFFLACMCTSSPYDHIAGMHQNLEGTSDPMIGR